MQRFSLLLSSFAVLSLTFSASLPASSATVELSMRGELEENDELKSNGRFDGTISYDTIDLEILSPGDFFVPLNGWNLNLVGRISPNILKVFELSSSSPGFNEGGALSVSTPADASKPSIMSMYIDDCTISCTKGTFFKASFELPERINNNPLDLPRLLSLSSFESGNWSRVDISDPLDFDILDAKISSVPLPPALLFLSVSAIALGWVGSRRGRRFDPKASQLQG